MHCEWNSIKAFGFAMARQELHDIAHALIAYTNERCDKHEIVNG